MSVFSSSYFTVLLKVYPCLQYVSA